MDYQLDEHYEVSKDIMGTKIKHPAFGTFRINRSSCGEHPLFGSSITHRDVMTLTVSHASEHRDLHNDWIHAERPIVEFEMSYSQFMEAICNQTSGTGIPCTINYTEKDGRTPKCKFIDKKQEFQDEFQAKIDEVNAVANTLYAEVKELFDNKKNISKTDRNEILKKINTIIHRIPSATKFAQSQFDEQMEQSAMEAKGEIESFFQHKINAIASGALQENMETLLEIKAPNIPQICQTDEDNEETESEDMYFFDVVLLEKEGIDGLSMDDILDLFPRLKEHEAYPIELEALEHESVAMGFITPTAAESLDYEYKDLRIFIAGILDDMEKESANGQYEFQTLHIYLSR